ncbi:MAG: tetratricopeptide repeat protein, partial [Treponema sp.]|nr:tetratricopeptide repeat protein [Treponema sp.]
VDPTIPLPVETAADDMHTFDAKDLAENLSWEMILAGMIRIIAEEKNPADLPAVDQPAVKPHWVNYYRQFVLTLKPEIYNEFTGAAVIKARNRDFDEALEIISILEGLFPDSPQVLLNKALIQEEETAELERKGCEMEAALLSDRTAETYKRALAMEPVLPELYYNLGFFYSARKNFGKAREFFNEYLAVANDAEKKEKAEKIAGEIEKTGLDNPKYTESLELIRQGKETQALALIHDFIAEYPMVWNAWFVLGWALRKLGRYGDALASFRKAAELGGKNADTRNETAICLMEVGEFPEARKELETALWEDPENVKIISNLGIIALKTGREKEASGFFRTVLELNPQDPLAIKFFNTP